MADLSIYTKHSRLYSFLCTIFIVGIIFGIFFLYIIHTPNPPFPDTGGGGTGNGIELNLGFSDMGMGDNQAEMTIPEEKVATPPEEAIEEEKIVTQDNEDAPVIQEAKKPKKEVKKEKITPVKPTPVKTTPVEKALVKPTVNTNALYKPKTSGGDGTTNTHGDQGSPDGDIGAKAFGKGGSGGSGGGSGGGTGTGIGTGTGSGISYSLEGRSNIQAFPLPKSTNQVEGTVVVEITVDKNGVVTKAIPGVKGSTTLDDELLDAARSAATQAKFNRKPDAPAYQKGYITYRFRLQ
jgi:TonB family protein